MDVLSIHIYIPECEFINKRKQGRHAFAVLLDKGSSTDDDVVVRRFVLLASSADVLVAHLVDLRHRRQKRIGSRMPDQPVQTAWLERHGLKIRYRNWNGNVIILTKFSSLTALEVVGNVIILTKCSPMAALGVFVLTTFSATIDENFVSLMTFPFQWERKVHCNDVILTSWHFNSPTNRLFVQPIVKVDNKEIINAPDLLIICDSVCGDGMSSRWGLWDFPCVSEINIYPTVWYILQIP